MAWIELHQSLTTHKKTRRLARKLGLGVPEGIPQTIGHLCLFWLWCVDGTDEGKITDLDAQDIADAAGWTGDPDIFCKAMIDSGFIEKTETETVIHDWRDYIGKLLDRRKETREKERDRKRAYRQRLKEAQQEKTESEYDYEISEDDIDPEWLKVAKAYETNIGLLPIGTALDDLQTFTDKLGADVVCEAITITNKAQASNPWKYLNKVLTTWEEKEINTIEKAKAYNKDLERKLEQYRKQKQPETSEPPAITGGFY